jgi:hypothetical protein
MKQTKFVDTTSLFPLYTLLHAHITSIVPTKHVDVSRTFYLSVAVFVTAFQVKTNTCYASGIRVSSLCNLFLVY